MSGTADVLVIGGGMAGISAGARLAEAGLAVTVLEREAAIGQHSTGRSAAMYIPSYGNAVLRALIAAGAEVMLEPGALDEAALTSPRGMMLVAAEAELPAFEAMLVEPNGMERMNPEEARAWVPILRPEAVAAAARDPAAMAIDVDLMLQGFARALRAVGGQVVLGAEVRAIARQGGAWVVETAVGGFSAPVVVNAAGAWADELARLAGLVPVGLQPMRRTAAILPAPEGHAIDGWPLVASAAEAWYFKPEAGKLLVSPAEEDPVEPMDAWPDDMVLAEGLWRFEQAVNVPVTRVERSWAGLPSFAPDRTPVAGFDPRAEGFFWLAGQGGNGIQAAPGLARLSADLIVGAAPSLPAGIVAALSPARFAA